MEEIQTMTRILRVATAVALSLALAPAAVGQGRPGLGPYSKETLTPGVSVGAMGMYIDCHATFFRAGTSLSYTPNSWKIAVPMVATEDDRMDACKASATGAWLENGKILQYLNYSAAEQDQICRAGSVTIRTDYGWQERGSRSRQPSFIYQVSSPNCSCVCNKAKFGEKYIPDAKQCGTPISPTPGMADGDKSGGYWSLDAFLYGLNSNPFTCKFTPTATQSR
jgi:hypothetical protein